VRPATDALRQALFSSIGARVEGARFLDLFAGSGAYGLEALSRGAMGGLFVERDRRAVTCLEKNLAAVCKSLGQSATPTNRFTAFRETTSYVSKTPTAATISRSREVGLCRAKILTADVTSPSWEMAAAALAPNLIFIDPPYEIIETIALPLFARLRKVLLPQTLPESPLPQPGPLPSRESLSPPLTIFELPGGLKLAPEGWHLIKRLGGKSSRQPSLALFEPVAAYFVPKTAVAGSGHAAASYSDLPFAKNLFTMY